MIIGLSGYARSGKDTVAEQLVLKHGFKQYSFAEPMKKAMYILNPIVKVDEVGMFTYQGAVDAYGIDEAKVKFPEIRRLLQVFGTEVGREMFGNNFWVDLCLNNVESDLIVVSDVRFVNEAEAIRSRGGQVWRIDRPGIGPVTGHASETALDGYKFDQILKNSGTLEEFNELVDRRIEWARKNV